MRRNLPFFLFTILMMLGCSKPKDAAPADESRVHRDDGGQPVVTVNADTQKIMGLKTTALEAVKIEKETIVFGNVLDPSSLITLAADLASAQAAGAASQADSRRVKVLASQDNASARAVETADAAAARDAILIESARLRLLTAWGAAIADRPDLSAFVQSLAKLDAVLVLLNVPPNESLQSMPSSARLSIATTESNRFEATFLGPAPSADPQVQGRSLLFLVSPNTSRVTPGTAITGWITTPGTSLSGIALPREAVIRNNGASWVYVQASDHEFRRTEVRLETPTTNGWLITDGLKPADNVVTTGAQQLLSEELKD